MVNDGLLRLACSGLDPVRMRRLLDAEPDARRVADRIAAGRIEAADHIRSGVAVSAAERRRQLDAAGVRILDRTDPEFPEVMSSHPEAPVAIFVAGRLPATPGIAIVGTRRCTGYGRTIALRFGEACAAAGYTVVSGLARGIDGAAHRGTCDRAGFGIAVLGSGLDVWYPPEHRALGEQLIELGGAVISEYPLGSLPEPWRFPLRNRIIADLAAAVVVVEAGVRGGALITAANAAERGLPVFAVPGDVDRDASVGCNLLIRDGAIPVLGVEDLLEALTLVTGLRPRNGSVAPAPESHWLLDRIPGGGIARDDLVVAAGRPAAEVVAELSRLEADGRIGWDGGRIHPRGAADR